MSYINRKFVLLFYSKQTIGKCQSNRGMWWVCLWTAFPALALGMRVVDLIDPQDKDILEMALVDEGAEVEVFPMDDVYFPNESFSLCVRKYKEFGRYIDSMPFFHSDWNETINETSEKTPPFVYNERVWPYPSGLAEGDGCNCSIHEHTRITPEAMLNTGWYVPGGMGPMAKPHQWIHACNVYDAQTKEFKLYFNGELIPLSKITMEHPKLKLNGTTKLCQIKIGSSVVNEKANLFLGKTTDINMYSRALSLDEVKQYATCNLTQGDLIAWNKTNITLNTARARIIEIAASEVCSPDYHVLPLSIPSVALQNSLATCEKLGRTVRLLQPETEEVYNAMLSEARRSKAMATKCSGNNRQRMWTSVYWDA